MDAPNVLSLSLHPGQVIGLPNAFDPYVRHGWALVPIPPGHKGPRNAGWHLRENVLTTTPALPMGWGVGLAHAYSGTMALDIDDWGSACTMLAEHGVDLSALYDAPDAVIIDSGRAGRGKLLYSMPLGSTMPSRRVVHPLTGKVVYELRCATLAGHTVQDVLPPSIHPLTGQPYRWAGKGHFTRTPMLPPELLTLWDSLTKVDRKPTIDQGSTTIKTSWYEVQGALSHVSPDCSHDDWLTVGMALHYAASQHTDEPQEAYAFHLWDEWSRQSSSKYPGVNELATRWRSFKSGKPLAVKLGSLFRLAAHNGWKPIPPDISNLFKPSDKPMSPNEALDLMRTPRPQVLPDLFPEVLHRRALELSVGINVDIAQPLWAGMAAASGCIDARTRLELAPGYRVPPVLWVMSIGSPATKKTPASTPMFTHMQQIEVQSEPEYRQALARWEVLATMHDKSKVAQSKAMEKPDFLLASAASGEPDMSVLPPVTRDPGAAPVPKRLVIKDVTSQKMARMLAERPYGMLALLDEMKSWCDKLINPASGEDRSTWTVAYEAKHHVVDRVSEKDAIRSDNFALAIFGNIQPAVYRDVQRKLGNDGLLQRFIQVPLGEEPYEEPRPIPAMFSTEYSWAATLDRIHAMPPTIYGLSPDATIAFKEFQTWYLRTKRIEQLTGSQSNLYLEAFGKLEGLMGRLALVMHMLENPNSLYVTGDTMRRAALVIQSYVVPAYRYALYEVATTIEETMDHWVLKHIVQLSGEVQTVTLSELVRSARRQFAEGISSRERAEIMEAGMVRLEPMGYVIETRRDAHGVQWAINPNLAHAHSTYRKGLIDAQKAQQQGFRDTVAQLKSTQRRTMMLGVEGDT